MTLACHDPLDAIGYAVESLRAQGVPLKQMYDTVAGAKMMTAFGMGTAICVVRDRPGKRRPSFGFFCPNYPLTRALEDLKP